MTDADNEKNESSTPPARAEGEGAPDAGSAAPESAPAPAASAPIPRSVSGKRLALWGLVAVMMLYVGALVGPTLGAGLHALWHALGGSRADDAHHSGATQYYTCGMHPWVIQPKPGDCPICGMKLVPLDPAKFSGEVTIDPVVSQNIGVRVEKVSAGSESGTLRTVGTVTYDETRLGDVNLKVSGWIEKLYVDYLGAPVKRGQPLFDLYSPELYAAEGEYLLAFKASQRASGDATRAGLVGELLEPARTKLSLFDIGPKQIAALEARGQPFKNLTISSPQSGVVIEKNAVEGMKMSPGMTAFRIADLSRVWVMATLYEYQTRQVQVGQKASMTLSYLPGQSLEGEVVYVYPFLDERTRQIKVRLEFPNPDLKLKPGMYTTVSFQGLRAESRPLVSRSAVIDTGERQVAFVARGEGRFEPREVHMGAETEGGKVEILDGLKPGELVVVSGQFLIDSEARMREALAKMIKGTTAVEATTPAAPPPERAAVSLPDAANAALESALRAYLVVQAALAADTTRDLGVAARKLADAVDALVAMPPAERPHFWHQHGEASAVKESAQTLASAATLADARKAFVSLSGAFSDLLHLTGVPKSYAGQLEDAHCPMYPAGSSQGAVWIQPEGALKNPYFGSAMPDCSDWQRPLKAAP